MENTGAGAVREPRLADFTLSSVFHWFVSQSAFTPHPVNRRKTGRIETVRDITDDIVDKLRGSLWFQMTRMCHRQLQPNFYCGDQDILLHFSGSCVTIVGKATKHAEVYHKKKTYNAIFHTSDWCPNVLERDLLWSSTCIIYFESFLRNVSAWTKLGNFRWISIDLGKYFILIQWNNFGKNPGRLDQSCINMLMPNLSIDLFCVWSHRLIRTDIWQLQCIYFSVVVCVYKH